MMWSLSKIDNSNVIFFTKCWNKDYHKFLQDEFQKKTPPFKFRKKILLINNEVPEVKFSVDTLKVCDYIPEVLDFFDLEPKSFTRRGHHGFWYSIAELTAIYFACGYEYLCWVQGDCQTTNDWITPGIKELKENENLAVISPASRVNTYGEIDQEFSDQAFLIKVSDFRRQIYNYDKPEQPNYPFYAGNSFEYKCGQYLKNNNKYRKILNDYWCEHIG